jgi:hypothetical protein
MHGLLGLAGILGLIAFAFGENAARRVVQAAFVFAGIMLLAFGVDVWRAM